MTYRFFVCRRTPVCGYSNDTWTISCFLVPCLNAEIMVLTAPVQRTKPTESLKRTKLASPWDFVCLVWCLTSQSTAMVMSRWSVHLTTLFLFSCLNAEIMVLVAPVQGTKPTESLKRTNLASPWVFVCLVWCLTSQSIAMVMVPGCKTYRKSSKNKASQSLRFCLFGLMLNDTEWEITWKIHYAK